MAQLRKRWGDDGAQIIMDTVGSQIVLPGIKDPKVLKDLSDACGLVSMQERGQHHHTQHPVLDTAMIRELPDKHALVIRGNRAPVVCKVRQIWGDRLYRRLRRQPLPTVRRYVQAVAEPPMTDTTPLPAALRLAPPQPPAAPGPEPAQVRGQPVTVPAGG